MKTEKTQRKIYQKLSISKPPIPVGSYEISGYKANGMHFYLNKKPKAIHRFFCKICLGWTWIDKDQS
jgi:hypothetical protein